MSYNKFIPKVTKKGLLFVAGIAWLVVSFYLIYRAVANFMSDNMGVIFRILLAIPLGILLYYIIFKKVFFRYFNYIVSKNKEKCSIFEFMGLKAYMFILIMSAINFSIELYRLLALDYLLTFQAIMSVPVFLSAILFFKAWKTYDA